MYESVITCLLSIILFMMSFASIHASDGQFQINQACAVNTGRFTGDAPGFFALTALESTFLSMYPFPQPSGTNWGARKNRKIAIYYSIVLNVLKRMIWA